MKRSVTNMTDGIVVAGSIIVDKIYEIPVYPNSGELVKILGESKAIGGLTPNVGIDIKRAFPDITVKAVGKIGNDELGVYAKKVLTENGIDVTAVKEGNASTSYTLVTSVIGGQRTFFSYAGANNEFGYDDVDFNALNAKMIHLGYFLLLEKIDAGDGLKILKKAKETGVKTSIDLVTENSNRYSLVKECLPYVDNLIINEEEAGRICNITPTEENIPLILKTLKSFGVNERVIIHTPNAGYCYDAELTVYNSINVPKDFIKGKTGAGDAFCAGALVGIYKNLSNYEILKMATVTATCSLRSAGAIDGISKYEEMLTVCDNIING